MVGELRGQGRGGHPEDHREAAQEDGAREPGAGRGRGRGRGHRRLLRQVPVAAGGDCREQAGEEGLHGPDREVGGPLPAGRAGQVLAPPPTRL